MSAEAQRAGLIEDSLEIAAAAGDPSRAIYRPLFAVHKEREALFDGDLALERDPVCARCGPDRTPAMDTAWSHVLEAARRLR